MAIALGTSRIARGGKRREVPQAGGGDCGSRAIDDAIGALRHVEIPWWDQVARTLLDKAIGVPLGDEQIAFLAGVGEDGAEAVKRPGESARPGRIRAEPLMSSLPQEGTRAGIEDPFVSGRAVG